MTFSIDMNIAVTIEQNQWNRLLRTITGKYMCMNPDTGEHQSPEDM